ncbi:hypothetical protein [Butyricicoccus porcorum]|uniref:hypothetical protein n=1 Tax=Butyricicoccus porcorum TaxID=1945634 RepID=UPI003F4AA0D6
MVKYMGDLLAQMQIIITTVLEHLAGHPLSTFFLIFIVITIISNVIKRIFISQEKKYRSPYQTCEYLITGSNGQDCDHLSHRKTFKMNQNSCTGCRGKSLKMTDAEAENRIIKGVAWKCAIVLFANSARNILPYLSFIYTLTVTIFNKR